MQRRNHRLEGRDALRRRNPIAEVVRAVVEDDVGDATDAENIAAETLGQDLQEWTGLAGLVRDACRIAADALVDDRNMLAIASMQPPRHQVHEAIVLFVRLDRSVARR